MLRPTSLLAIVALAGCVAPVVDVSGNKSADDLIEVRFTIGEMEDPHDDATFMPFQRTVQTVMGRQSIDGPLERYRVRFQLIPINESGALDYDAAYATDADGSTAHVPPGRYRLFTPDVRWHIFSAIDSDFMQGLILHQEEIEITEERTDFLVGIEPYVELCEPPPRPGDAGRGPGKPGTIQMPRDLVPCPNARILVDRCVVDFTSMADCHPEGAVWKPGTTCYCPGIDEPGIALL